MFKIIKTKKVKESVDELKNSLEFCEEVINQTYLTYHEGTLDIDGKLKVLENYSFYRGQYLAYRNALDLFEELGLYKP